MVRTSSGIIEIKHVLAKDRKEAEDYVVNHEKCEVIKDKNK